jgi:hypothetical protein
MTAGARDVIRRGDLARQGDRGLGRQGGEPVAGGLPD